MIYKYLLLISFLCFEIHLIQGFQTYSVLQNTKKYAKQRILWPALPDRPFVTVWNIDTNLCKEKYNISIDLTYFDIVTNPNQTRDGNEIVIFYAPLLGLYPRYDDNGKPVNGGIPQLGNITAHFEKCYQDVDEKIPDKDFEGLAVIDWESWRPLWAWNGWGAGLIYQNASIAKVKKEHPDWPAKNVTELAATEFENAAKSYMLGTLQLVKSLRPKAKWGFYLYPDCFNYDKTGMILTCQNNTLVRNDEIQWLFDSSTALYPSTYLGTWFKNKPAAKDYTWNRINEAKRVDSHRPGHTSIPIYVYNNLVYRKTRDFLVPADINATSGTAAILGASGVVLWADYMDNSKNICVELSHYVSTKLGPFIKLLSDSAFECSVEFCNAHGRCVLETSATTAHQNLPYKMKLVVDLVLPRHIRCSVACQCYPGFEGDVCDHKIGFF